MCRCLGKNRNNVTAVFRGHKRSETERVPGKKRTPDPRQTRLDTVFEGYTRNGAQVEDVKDGERAVAAVGVGI